MNLDWLLEMIPRPERSGVEGAICSVAILFTLLAGSGGIDAACGILPWECTAQASSVSERHKYRDLHVQLIGPGKGHGTVCLYEEKGEFRDTSGQSHSFHAVYPSAYVEDCDWSGWHLRDEIPCHKCTATFYPLPMNMATAIHYELSEARTQWRTYTANRIEETYVLDGKNL